jgi:CRISPR/Cas system-associated protein Cas7 (RAMP superfamily)
MIQRIFLSFSLTINRLLHDAKLFRETRQEYEQSKEEMERFDSALKALKNLTKNL